MLAGRLRVFLLVFILGVAGSVVFYLLAYTPLRASLPSIPRIGADLDLRLENVNLVETKKGQKEWELWADRARVYRKRGVTLLDNVRVMVYPEKRKPIRVRSERGTLYNESRDMELEGNVVVVSEEGYTLSTEKLRWVAGRKEITTQEPVIITGDRLRVSGNGLLARTEDQWVRLNENVQATLY